MSRLRCSLFAAILVISSATFAMGGVIQGLGKSNLTPTALTTVSTSDGLTQPASTEDIQIGWQDVTTVLVEILLTIF